MFGNASFHFKCIWIKSQHWWNWRKTFNEPNFKRFLISFAYVNWDFWEEKSRQKKLHQRLIYICMIFQTFPDLSQSKTCSHIFNSYSITFWFNWVLYIFGHTGCFNLKIQKKIIGNDYPVSKRKYITTFTSSNSSSQIIQRSWPQSRGCLTFRKNTLSRFKNGKNVMRIPLDPSAAFSFKDLDGVFQMLCIKR